MVIPFDEIENAFFFVSVGQISMCRAFLCKETGEIFYTSDMGGLDDLPEDIDDNDKYIAIPHKNELNLGKALVIEFMENYLPEELERVYSFFRRKGAYSRFKNLLENKGMLEDWYHFEDTRQKQVLKEWCRENEIEIKD